MVARTRARYLAPIALVVTIGATYVVVHSGLAPKHRAVHSQTGQGSGRRRRPGARFYVVQPGDSLTAIAAKTRVSLSQIEQLNPALDPNSLQTGQRLRLRR